MISQLAFVPPLHQRREFRFSRFLTQLKRRLARRLSGREHREPREASDGVLISPHRGLDPLTADTLTGQSGHDVNHS